MLIKYHKIDFANCIPTPNRGRRYTPRYIVLHYTGATTASSTINWFKRKEAKASAHILIDEEGSVTQFAPFNMVTWHAGKSSWYNLIGLNKYAIGIELVNAGKLDRVGGKWYSTLDKREIPKGKVLFTNHKNESRVSAWQAYTEKQIDAAVEVSTAIASYYDIEDILGHEDIAPNRKTDPGPAFPMAQFKSKVLGRAIEEQTQFTTTVKLNIRAGAGTDYAPLHQPLEEGTVVEELIKEGNWSLVHVHGNTLRTIDLEGWVYNRYLQRISA